MSALIDVKMCEDEACGGYMTCPHLRRGTRSLGLSDRIPPNVSEEQALAYLGQELYLSKASTSDGTEHWTPDGLTFIAHRHQEAGEAAVTYVAALAASDADLDDLLAAGPPLDADTAQRRVERLAAERDARAA